ncbi:60S ACIDIC ribosomal protein P1 [Anaeramoeba flamelloides]|uniref:60S ACIDIC ribosomal protein P1 n=1 Tax=Anaeramoeba flamelloides TaxID=1746091 RepID=A0AAV7YIG7_9EUKA|nr:60S ACIDIC ribosomal protein P1 [Anaeramoeba flamelloides]
MNKCEQAIVFASILLDSCNKEINADSIHDVLKKTNNKCSKLLIGCWISYLKKIDIKDLVKNSASYRMIDIFNEENDGIPDPFHAFLTGDVSGSEDDDLY